MMTEIGDCDFSPVRQFGSHMVQQKTAGKPIREVLLCVDSRNDVNSCSNNTSCSFAIDLPERILSVRMMKLISVELPPLCYVNNLSAAQHNVSLVLQARKIFIIII